VKCNGINPTFIFSTSKYILRIRNFPTDSRGRKEHGSYLLWVETERRQAK
jgi:hypothetical protein